MTVMETKFRRSLDCRPKKERHCSTFGSSLNVTRNVGAFLGFVETSPCCERSGLAQSFMHCVAISHGAYGPFWSPDLSHWGSVNLKPLLRIHLLPAWSGKRYNMDTLYCVNCAVKVVSGLRESFNLS